MITAHQSLLPLAFSSSRLSALHAELAAFDVFGSKTLVTTLRAPHCPEVPVYTNEFWTAKQRAAHSLHEISYRACFKPQLPRFFIQRLTQFGDIVYDPFMGRGTTLLEAAFLGRTPWGCDINPLAELLVAPRLAPPSLQGKIVPRAQTLPLDTARDLAPKELLAFFHPKVLIALQSMKEQFAVSKDPVDAWLRMVATSRLTGHSAGFFSVYSLPPNQAVSVQSQLRINESRQQIPPERNIPAILVKKSEQLLKDLTPEESTTLHAASRKAQLFTGSCESTPKLASNSVQLVVTSPPFLNEVDYKTDNWLRCWFNAISLEKVSLWMIRKPALWQQKMTAVFRELYRVLKPGGHVAFEVGEVVNASIRLEELVVPAAMEAGMDPEFILINSQDFTKTSKCWGVDNQAKGTNTNRIVLLRKPSR